jgi:hypothetical protein
VKFLFVCVLAASLLARSNSKVEKLYSHKYDTLKIPKTDTMLVVKTHSYKMMNVWKDTVKL